jgi:hypothetical protein
MGTKVPGAWGKLLATWWAEGTGTSSFEAGHLSDGGSDGRLPCLKCCAFIDGLQQEMRAELGALNDAMPLSWLEIRPRPGNHGAVKFSPLDALLELQNLGRGNRACRRGWFAVSIRGGWRERQRWWCRTGSR